MWMLVSSNAGFRAWKLFHDDFAKGFHVIRLIEVRSVNENTKLAPAPLSPAFMSGATDCWTMSSCLVAEVSLFLITMSRLPTESTRRSSAAQISADIWNPQKLLYVIWRWGLSIARSRMSMRERRLLSFKAWVSQNVYSCDPPSRMQVSYAIRDENRAVRCKTSRPRKVLHHSE